MAALIHALAAIVVVTFGAPSSTRAAAPQNWETISRTASQLALDNKAPEAIAMVAQFLAKNPNVAEAHYLQARFYEDLAGFGQPTPDERKHLENAVKHYARAADLLSDPRMQFLMFWKLQQLHEADRLNQPAEAERYARRMVMQFPERHESHMVYAQLLRGKGDIAGAAETLRKGRVAAPDLPIPGLLLLHQYLLEQVQESRALPRESARKVLEEAASLADVVIAHPAREDRDYRLATFGKAMALELLAERVEQDRSRRLALMVESRRLSAPIAELKKNPNPPAKPLTAKEAAALEWEYSDRWTWRLVDAGDHAAAIAAYQKYIAEHPDFDPPIERLADAYLKWADDATDQKTKTAAWQGALVPLQRLIGLAPSADARSYAYERVHGVLGPARLNRPDQQEAAARVMIQRYPADAAAYYALAGVLLRGGRAAEADNILRGARSAIKSTAASRPSMAGRALGIVRSDPDLPPAAARRLFDEADALILEAEKLAPNGPDVLAARGGWLIVKSDRFETDPARKKALAEQGKRLLARSIELQQKKR